MIRVALLADDPHVRKSVEAALQSADTVRVVGRASVSKTALAEARGERPDVLVVHLVACGASGITTVRDLLGDGNDRPLLVILTSHADADYAVSLFKAGAMAYVVHGSACSELSAAIKAVQEGRRFVSSMIRDTLAARYLSTVAGTGGTRRST